MKTAWRDRYGPPEILSVREVADPAPGAGQITVRVRATTVNRTDCGGLWGAPYIFRFFVGWPRPRHAATGTDFAGEVVAVGPGVTRFAVGDRVMGFDDTGVGSHAEQLCIDAGEPIVAIPAGIDFETAAASIEGAHYARNFMNKVELAAGDRVLVYGATGAIGSAAIPLLVDRGIEVTAVCAAPHLERVAALGAARVVDYTAGSFVEQLRGEPFAHVLDAVGKSTVGECAPLIAKGGTYASSELGPWGQNIWYALLGPLKPGPRVRFPVPKDIPASLALVARLLAEGRFAPLVDRRYPLDEVADAFRYVASGQKIGNVLLVP
ncbi:MAG: NAD(P)-dependent alcohol dehydrogenase [bacterium]